jgi:hypothetical protein
MSTRAQDADDWFKLYKPVVNHLYPNASWCYPADGEGVMFETYGEEVEYVLQADPKHVWTYMDADDGLTIICAGYHYVNRIGYFITELPWTDPDAYFSLRKSRGDYRR